MLLWAAPKKGRENEKIKKVRVSENADQKDDKSDTDRKFDRNIFELHFI